MAFFISELAFYLATIVAGISMIFIPVIVYAYLSMLYYQYKDRNRLTNPKHNGYWAEHIKPEDFEEAKAELHLKQRNEAYEFKKSWKLNRSEFVIPYLLLFIMSWGFILSYV
jgi:hypothetical protein